MALPLLLTNASSTITKRVFSLQRAIIPEYTTESAKWRSPPPVSFPRKNLSSVSDLGADLGQPSNMIAKTHQVLVRWPALCPALAHVTSYYLYEPWKEGRHDCFQLMDEKLKDREVQSYALGTAKEEDIYLQAPNHASSKSTRHVLNTDYMQMEDERMSEKAPISKDSTA